MYSDEEKAALGLTRLLPTSLDAALEELEKDRPWVEGALGKEYMKWFFILKKAEMKKLAEMDADERKLLMIQHF
jgi:glutamine synthetase